jgi:uncharacterized membrane protein YfcA
MVQDLVGWISDASARSWIIVLLASVLGRMMFHAHQVQRGARRFWSWHLVSELPIAGCMGLIGGAIGEWFGLEGRPLLACAAIVGYLGPHAIDELFVTMRDAFRTRLSGRTPEK